MATVSKDLRFSVIELSWCEWQYYYIPA